jgi:hypothetical protein
MARIFPMRSPNALAAEIIPKLKPDGCRSRNGSLIYSPRKKNKINMLARRKRMAKGGHNQPVRHSARMSVLMTLGAPHSNAAIEDQVLIAQKAHDGRSLRKCGVSRLNAADRAQDCQLLFMLSRNDRRASFPLAIPCGW